MVTLNKTKNATIKRDEEAVARERSARTVIHVSDSANVPVRNIAVELGGFVKHCNNQKRTRIQNIEKKKGQVVVTVPRSNNKNARSDCKRERKEVSTYWCPWW